MTRGRPNGLGARPLGVMALCWALALATPGRARAGSDGPSPAPTQAVQLPADAGAPIRSSEADDATLPEGAARGWISIGLLAGTTQFDAGLADYQWDTSPRPGWGFRALLGRGPVAAGVRFWRAASTQSIGDLGAAPRVRATSWELVGEGRLARRWGTELLVTGGAGRLHLGYEPDRISLQPPGPVSPIVVELTPVGAWIGGGGLAVRRAVRPGWTVALGIDARVFSIDTAHRAGDTVVLTRESFGDWNARLEFAWRHGRR